MPNGNHEWSSEMPHVDCFQAMNRHLYYTTKHRSTYHADTPLYTDTAIDDGKIVPCLLSIRFCRIVNNQFTPPTKINVQLSHRNLKSEGSEALQIRPKGLRWGDSRHIEMILEPNTVERDALCKILFRRIVEGVRFCV